MAADLGLAVVRLQPGGSSRVNPMDPARGDGDDSVIARQSLAAQLVAGVLGRDLALEDAVLGWAVEQRCRTGQAFTMRDLCGEILDPPDELVRLSRHTPLELARAYPVTFALDKLCGRTLRSMFDGPPPSPSTGTTARAWWSTCPPSTRTPTPSMVMAAATHWLAGALRGHPQRRAVQVIDEAWAAVRHGAAYFQSSTNCPSPWGRHRAGLPPAVGPDGAARRRDGLGEAIAAGLLSDIQTRVLLRQPPEQVTAAAADCSTSPSTSGTGSASSSRPCPVANRRPVRRRPHAC